MRWIWIDRFTEFVSGSHGVAVKNVSLAEECLKDHLPGYPVFPPSLMIEGMAQTAGILVGEARGFNENVILAKIREASYSDYAVPGDQLRYHAKIETIDENAAATTGETFLNGKSIGQTNFLFSHVSQDNAAVTIPKDNFVFTEEFMRIFRSIGDATESKAAST